jgi:hypothetical protein
VVPLILADTARFETVRSLLKSHRYTTEGICTHLNIQYLDDYSTKAKEAAKATVMVLIWNLGAVVLHRHAQRLLGVDILAGGAEDKLAWIVPATEILAEGVITKETLEQLRAAVDTNTDHDLWSTDTTRT